MYKGEVSMPKLFALCDHREEDEQKLCPGFESYIETDGEKTGECKYLHWNFDTKRTLCLNEKLVYEDLAKKLEKYLPFKKKPSVVGCPI